MNGTSFSHTFEMDSTPPKMTTETNTTMAMPMIHTGIHGAFETMMPVMADACTAEPVPIAAMAANAAKATAPMRAHQGVEPSLRLKARSHMNIAPPSISPLWSFTRYLMAANTSEYLVAMPNTPVSHIQNTAPGPPARMAVATPTIDPVPMVAARAVAKAPKCEISPSAPASEVNESLMAFGSLRWMKPVLTVRNRWLPSRSAIIAGPHTKLSIVLSNSIIA